MKQRNLALALSAALSLGSTSTFAQAPADGNGITQSRWIVTMQPGRNGERYANVANDVRARGGDVVHVFAELNAVAVRVSGASIEHIKDNPNVLAVEEDPPRPPMGQVTPYGITNVQAPQTVATGADGTGIKVCIIDSGIKSDHEDFAGVAMTGQSGQDWGNDTCGHGTHVAGTIAAVNNSAGVLGVSPGKVSLHVVKVFDGAACEWSYASDLIAAAQECKAAGAKVINMSLGGPTASVVERNAFQSLYDQGVLSIAAAGNAGNTQHSYPASYDSVMSVAAVDAANVKAAFSQSTNQVEISAPGVGVLSTYPTRDGAVTVGGVGHMAWALTGSPQLVGNGALVNGGRCTAAGAWAGKVVLCERGDISFADKVLNAQAGGATAAIVYNNAAGGFLGTLNGVATSIPSVSISREDGLTLVGSTAATTVSAVAQTDVSGYAYLDGTSMATPHVSGVAAIVWSAKPSATNAQVRAALTSTALDLEAAGRDNNTGYGLVRAFNATEALLGGGGGGEPAPAPAGLTATNTGSVKGKVNFRLNWTAGGSSVDVYRGATKIGSAVANTGTYTDAVKVRGSGSFTYQVCNAGTTTCSSSVSVSY